MVDNHLIDSYPVLSKSKWLLFYFTNLEEVLKKMVTRLKKARLEGDLSQLQLSAEAGVTEKQVSATERGFVTSKPGLKRMANYFDLDEEEALEEVDEEEVA